MNQGIMPNGYVVANGGAVFLVGAVYYGAVLNVHFVAHFYKVNVAPNYGTKPYAALVAHFYVAHYGGVFCYVAVVWNLWRNAVYWFYYWHGNILRLLWINYVL